MKKIFALVMVVTLLGAFMLGCSSGSSDTGSNGSSSSTPAAGGSSTSK